MTQQSNSWQHNHHFGLDSQAAEKKVYIVFVLTALTMVVEIVAGSWFGSMALLADGWHMFTHAAAFAVSLFVYWYARKHQHNPAYSFGTGKVTVLGGFASAIALGTVALMMVIESVERLFSPEDIYFNEAIGVALVGLVVNLVSAVILHNNHHHGHAHGHSNEHSPHHDHDHHHEHHHDHNLAAAYFHVLADTLTSLFAIVALLCGKYYGWVWADAVMGIIASLVIAKWAYGLLRETSGVLLDKAPSVDTQDKIAERLNELDVTITDLHVWRLSGNHQSAIVAVATHTDLSPDDIKQHIQPIIELAHLTVEVNRLEH